MQGKLKAPMSLIGSAIALTLLATGCSAGSSESSAPSSASNPAATASASESASASDSPSAHVDGELMVNDVNSKYMKELTPTDVKVDSSFSFGKDMEESAIRDGFELLSLFNDEFPQYQVAGFPALPIGDYLVNEIEPKVKHLVTPELWKPLAQNFVSGTGQTMFMNSIFSGNKDDALPARNTWQLSEGNSCTATDQPMDVRYSNNKLALEQDPATEGDVAVLTTTVTYTVQCTEGKPFWFKADTTLKLRPMGDHWIASDATRAAAYDMKILTPPAK